MTTEAGDASDPRRVVEGRRNNYDQRCWRKDDGALVLVDEQGQRAVTQSVTSQ